MSVDKDLAKERKEGMTVRLPRARVLRSAHDDAQIAGRPVEAAHCQSPSYRLAFQDPEFLLRDELRPVRLQLELLKPELILQEHQIESAIVVFGSARIPEPQAAREALREAEVVLQRDPGNPTLQQKFRIAERQLANSRYYDEARRLATFIATHSDDHRFVVMTGGGPGIMEAANRGAYDASAASIGMNIVLPHEQLPNPYITPDLNFRFHYFAIRKMHLVMRAKCLIAFPGGFGTLDELFETLTLIQTGKIRKIPVLLFGKAFWTRVINFQALAEEGTISAEDLNLFTYVETAEEAWEHIVRSGNVQG
jgi:uncharacterized protein (TIGR00730 family)